MSLNPGARLGPYEVVSRLGAGGMGEVWKAHDTRLQRDVAIKVLPDDLASDRDRIRRFEQEARAIAALNHPHICQIHDVGPTYLVLEYIEGTPLRGPVTADEAVRLAIQMASALEAAHARAVLHRDLKPSNVLVTPAGTAKLLDFGIAKLMTTGDGDLTRTADGMTLGTAAYMSPEQAQGKAVDVRSDIFSFGSIVYELIAGRQAFAGTSQAEVVSAVLRDQPQPLPSSSLARVVGRCLEKDAARRYQTMAEVRAALEDVGRARRAEGVEPSIAVLPFDNLSADKENEYFSDGLSEEIINALTRIPGLKVIARTSAFAFKGKHEDVRRIAEALGVTTVLEGSVRRAGNRIRVTAQLITASDGSHAWSERYDRELIDVFAVQDDIAASIVRALQITLSPAAMTGRRYTPALPAYEHYLKALYHSQRRTPDSIELGRQHFEQAIALDSQFALAHAEFGQLFYETAIYGLMQPREAMPLVQREARLALAIDPESAEAHAMLGTAAAMFDYNWQDAARHYALAMRNIAIAPRVHRYYAHYYLLPMGRAAEAIEHHTFSVDADPLNLAARAERAVCLRAVGRDEEANEALRQVIERDPSNWFPYFILGVNYAVDREFDKALAMSEQAYGLAPWFKPNVGYRAGMLKLAGHTDRAEELLRPMLSSNDYVDPIGPAMFYLVTGDLESTADWVERAIDQRQAALGFFVNAHAKALKSTARWPALARMMNLPV